MLAFLLTMEWFIRVVVRMTSLRSTLSLQLQQNPVDVN